ncbi:MAG: hypothetical protein OEZ32_09230 [Nitrospinota bacterium]|nr:hypothetical protein [Nitrospinota bacterium]
MGKVSFTALALSTALALVLTTGTGCGRKGPPVAPAAGEISPPSDEAPSGRR